MFAFALIAVPMILLSVDMGVSYRFYPVPEKTTENVQITQEDGSVVEETRDKYTPVGWSQRKRDIAWALVLFGGGVVMLLWSLRNLIVPRRLLVADEDGLSIAVGPRRSPPLLLAWEDVAEIRSGIWDDDGGSVPVLSIRFRDPLLVPRRPRAAAVDTPWLHLFAEEWDQPAHQVATLLEARVGAQSGWEAYG
jgi:hypothetical protein